MHRFQGWKGSGKSPVGLGALGVRVHTAGTKWPNGSEQVVRRDRAAIKALLTHSFLHTDLIQATPSTTPKQLVYFLSRSLSDRAGPPACLCHFPVGRSVTEPAPSQLRETQRGFWQGCAFAGAEQQQGISVSCRVCLCGDTQAHHASLGIFCTLHLC